MSEVGKQIKGYYKVFRLFNWDLGLNSSASPTDIDDRELQDVENLSLDEQGVLKKRKGLRRINPQIILDELPAAGGDQGYNDPNFPDAYPETNSQSPPPSPTPPVQPDGYDDGYGG